MGKYKKLTHVLAVVIAGVATFFATPAGLAVVKQYPVLAPAVAGLAMIAALYRSPKNGPTPQGS